LAVLSDGLEDVFCKAREPEYACGLDRSQLRSDEALDII
jgi:hypothetical protein